jgi:hypothetical protein
MTKQFRTLAAALALAGATAVLRGQPAPPALTLIQDTIYKADGTRFRGVAVVEWKSFTTATGANIGMQTTMVPIVDGIVRVRLAPTTNVSGGAYYQVRYNSDGRIQFTEFWSVPPSNSTLKLADVRTSTPGQSSVPGGTTGPLQMTDVIGLTQELGVRPSKGPGFASGRAAVVNPDGLLESAGGNPEDCLRVDGSSGPCASSVGSIVDQEVLAGTLDGVNAVFSLAAAPQPTASLTVYRNGLRLAQGADFNLSGSSITFAGGQIPQPGDLLIATYRTGGVAGQQQGGSQVAGPLGTPPAPQVVCSAAGGWTQAGAPQTLGTCLIPASQLGAGDRFESRADYAHSGSQGGFSATVTWGSAAILNRTAAAEETALAGRSEVTFGEGTAQWAATSWGASSAPSHAAGAVAQPAGQGVLITFSASTAAAGPDTVRLRSYTVIRYRSFSVP